MKFVKWELLNNNEVISSGNLLNAEINKEIKLTNYKEFISLDGEKEELEFRLWLSYSESVDQSAMLNKSLSGKLKVIANEIPENLFTNGDLRRGAYNWEPFIYDESEKALKYASNSYQAFGLGNYIEVNPNGTYEESIEMKSSNTEAKYYAGIVEYDVDKNRIGPMNFMYIGNTLTELTEDLENGDTVVHLKDLTNWDTTSENVTTNIYAYLRHGFIFWNYKDSTGYLYPEETYSRNFYYSLYENENVNKENNTITLNEPWSNGTISKGTKLSQTNSGGAYNYMLINNASLTTSWKTYTDQLSKVIDNGDMFYTKFRPGMRYIRFLILNNNNETLNTTTYLKNISFKRID